MFKKLFKEIWVYKKLFLISMAAGTVMSLAAAEQAVLVRQLFDAISNSNREKLLESLGLILVVALIAGIARYFSSYMGQFLSDLVSINIRQKLQRKFLRLNNSFYGKYEAGSGGLMSRILNDVNQVHSGLHQFAALFREPILFFLLMGWLFYLDWKLTLILITTLPFIAKFSRQIARSLQKYNHLAQNEIEKLTSNIKETLDGVRVIQSFNLENEMQERFDEIAQKYLVSRRKIQMRSEAASPITEYVATLIFASLFMYFASKMSNLGGLGDFMSYITAMLMLSKPVTKIQDSYVKLQSAIVSGQRIFEILENESEVEQIEGSKPFPTNWNKIEFRNVSFRYGEEWVLRNFNLTVNRGEVVALVGESGGGKSTVVNLLERFFDPSEGQILIDDEPIQNLNLHSLRKNVSLVNQDVFLFNESAAYNIRTGDLDRFSKSDTSIVDASVESSAKAANADQFLLTKPGGYNFKVGERGGLLSGGEKQRLSIARAFYKDSPILILDEATSALDSSSEAEVQKGIEKLMSGRTVFVIAHRLSTIIHADKILVLKGGKVVEQGDHQSLLEKQGEYFRFRNLQVT